MTSKYFSKLVFGDEDVTMSEKNGCIIFIGVER